MQLDVFACQGGLDEVIKKKKRKPVKYQGEDGVKTIADLASELKISISTARRYIRSEKFPSPQRRYFASQSVAIFSDEYIEKAKEIMDRLRQ